VEKIKCIGADVIFVSRVVSGAELCYFKEASLRRTLVRSEHLGAVLTTELH